LGSINLTKKALKSISHFGNEQQTMAILCKTIIRKELPLGSKSFISKYATSHPWEDWAETWAHYLHIMDMLETAYFFGLNVNPSIRVTP
jgi:hypothetical protein